MKYWTLYWKNIEDMTREELIDNLVNALNEVNRLSWIAWDNKISSLK